MTGLQFLRLHFPALVIDFSFVRSAEELVRLLNIYGEADSQNYWRIRCSNPMGTEMGLPMGTFYSNEDANGFICETQALHPGYSYILHWVDDEYYYPDFCGTIEVVPFPSPVVSIELQQVSREMIAQMDHGARPRDWPSCYSERDDFTQPLPTVVSQRGPDELRIPQGALGKLRDVALRLAWIYYSSHANFSTFTRFNICAGGRIVLNDHRAGQSFSSPKASFSLESRLFSPLDEILGPELLRGRLVEQRRTVANPRKDATKSPHLDRPDTKSRLRGLGASRGTATGRAVLADTWLRDSDLLPRGVDAPPILICRTMSPDLVGLMGQVAGLVADEGGLTSHAAIVSRELGVPCVVGAVRATELIRSGDEVSIDGVTGDISYGALADDW